MVYGWNSSYYRVLQELQNINLMSKYLYTAFYVQGTGLDSEDTEGAKYKILVLWSLYSSWEK